MGDDPGYNSDVVESNLDIEWANAIARGAQIIYVYGQSAFGAAQFAVDFNVAPVLSLSFGSCEAYNQASFRTVAQQAVAPVSYTHLDVYKRQAFEDVVGGFLGLDDFKPVSQIVRPAYTSSKGKHSLVPDDLAAIYNIAPLYAAGIDGDGQNIAIIGDSSLDLSDLRAFRQMFNLPYRCV